MERKNQEVVNKSFKEDEINQYFCDTEFEETTNLERMKFIFEGIIDSLYLLRCLCCFTALLVTPAMLQMIFSFSINEWSILFLAGGYLSILIACPNRVLQFFCNSVVAGFQIGFKFLKVGCVIGAALGIIWALIVILFIPAFVITIPYFIFVLRFY